MAAPIPQAIHLQNRPALQGDHAQDRARLNTFRRDIRTEIDTNSRFSNALPLRWRITGLAQNYAELEVRNARDANANPHIAARQIPDLDALVETRHYVWAVVRLMRPW